MIMFQAWNTITFQAWNMIMFQANMIMFQAWNMIMFQAWNLFDFLQFLKGWGQNGYPCSGKMCQMCERGASK